MSDAESDDGNTTVADVLRSCLTPNETCNATDLQKELVEKQPLVKCLLSLEDNFTFGIEALYVALDQLHWYNETAFELLDQGNCSAL